MDTRPQLEREATRLIRILALAGIAWVALCGAGAGYLALYLTRPKEPPC